MQKHYTIRELTDEFDVTISTLRFYEEKGLINPTRNKQTRIYSSSDRTRLRLILRGKRLGLSLEESSAIILMYDQSNSNEVQLNALISIIREKRQQLTAQQKDFELMLLNLSDAEERCLDALSKITPLSASKSAS